MVRGNTVGDQKTQAITAARLLTILRRMHAKKQKPFVLEILKEIKPYYPMALRDVYRRLGQLHADGLVSREWTRDGNRNRRVAYRLTEKGLKS